MLRLVMPDGLPLYGNTGLWHTSFGLLILHKQACDLRSGETAAHRNSAVDFFSASTVLAAPWMDAIGRRPGRPSEARRSPRSHGSEAQRSPMSIGGGEEPDGRRNRRRRPPERRSSAAHSDGALQSSRRRGGGSVRTVYAPWSSWRGR